MDINCINGERDVLTYLPNPQIKLLKEKHKWLRRMKFCDEDRSVKQLPIHIIFRAAKYQNIWSTKPPICGDNPDIDLSIWEQINAVSVWIFYVRMVSIKDDSNKRTFAKSGQREFENLCSLDILVLIQQLDKNLQFNQDFQ